MNYSYSRIADEQLDLLVNRLDARAYNALVDTCKGILDEPGLARERSAVIATEDGMRFRSPVGGAFPYKVFWSLTDGVARIEAYGLAPGEQPRDQGYLP
ncbi:MAG: hypothetical protein HQ453_01505 [Actinobacteria bacterium]|nr:hypothetical protein [Actinomycetota bacterium]